MYDGLIPQRYAMALYKYAKDTKKTEEVYDLLKNVISSFESEPELQKVMANPFVSRDDKRRLLIAAAGDKADDDYKSFVNLILNHNREMFAHQMALAYRRIYRQENSISSVRIVTAANLSAEAEKRIDDLVRKSFPQRTLEIVHAVNPDLIGGFVIDVDNNRLDASISNELEQLRHDLITSN